MKKFIKFLNLVILSISIFSCEGPFLDDDDLLLEKAPTGKTTIETIIHEKPNYNILSKEYNGWGRGYYYTDSSRVQNFLFYVCEFDCNEIIFKTDLDTANQSFVCLIKNSTRFKTKNRLVLFQFKNKTPIKLLDSVSDIYKTFRFENNKLIYVLEDGTEKSIHLN